MKTIMQSVFFLIVLIGQVHADPVKCLSEGKTIYTDDTVKCQGERKAIVGNLVISNSPSRNEASRQSGGQWPAALPRPGDQQKTTAKPTFNLPAALGNLPLPAGITHQDIANGWQVIMDARQRGSWEAPKLPEYAK